MREKRQKATTKEYDEHNEIQYNTIVMMVNDVDEEIVRKMNARSPG